MSGRSKSRRRKSAIRRAASLEQANLILAKIASKQIDPYEGFKGLYITYLANPSALEILKPFFRTLDVDPDGVFSVTDTFRQQVIALAEEFLHQNGGGSALPKEK